MHTSTTQQSVMDAPRSSSVPAWLTNLDEQLQAYWETGEFPDDLDEAWFDRMIARVTPLA